MRESYGAHKRVTVLGSSYSALSFSEIVNRLIQHGKNKDTGYICVANVHTTMTGFFDSNYKEITNSSTYSVPDGQPIRWAMQFLTGIPQERVRGPSTMKAVCDQGRQVGIKHYLYGSSPETLAQLQIELLKKYPGIEIVGAESPPFRELTIEEKQKSISAINNSGADILWVGLGAPKQERWIWEHRTNIKIFMVGIGAAFDLLAGKINEAPMWMQNYGLEWLYRMYKEPKRLWQRYILNNPVFVLLFFLQFLCEKVFGIVLWKQGKSN